MTEPPSMRSEAEELSSLGLAPTKQLDVELPAALER